MSDILKDDESIYKALCTWVLTEVAFLSSRSSSLRWLSGASQ